MAGLMVARMAPQKVDAKAEKTAGKMAATSGLLSAGRLVHRWVAQLAERSVALKAAPKVANLEQQTVELWAVQSAALTVAMSDRSWAGT